MNNKITQESMNNKPNYAITIIVVVIVGAVAFYGGMQFQNRRRMTMMRTQMGTQFAGRMNGQNDTPGPNGMNMPRGNALGMRPLNGEVLSQDENSITIKMSDGSSKIIILSDQTIINKATAAPKTELKAYVQVTVFGTTNQDGSITAQNISIGDIRPSGDNSTGQAHSSASPSATPSTR